VMMALSADGAFPEAVGSVVDLIAPYELYLLAHSLLLPREHAALIEEYPRAFLRLTNAIIDPGRYAVPRDLPELLQRAANADPGCGSDPSYVRLFGLSRRVAA
jgi:hypothetical protein